LQKVADRPVYLIRGDIPVAKRKALLQQAMEERCYVVGTMMSCNTGINLTKFKDVVVGELYKSLHAMTQLMGRYERMGGEGSTTVTFLVLEGSHDEDIASVLIRRAEDIGAVRAAGAEQKVSLALEATQQSEDEMMARIVKRLGGQSVDEI